MHELVVAIEEVFANPRQSSASRSLIMRKGQPIWEINFGGVQRVGTSTLELYALIFEGQILVLIFHQSSLELRNLYAERHTTCFKHMDLTWDLLELQRLLSDDVSALTLLHPLPIRKSIFGSAETIPVADRPVSDLDYRYLWKALPTCENSPYEYASRIF